MTRFHSQFSCWMTFVIIAVGFSSPAVAARPERPKEIEKTYDFAGADMKGYGAEVNADISSVGRLFGTSADWNALLAQQPKEEEKGWLGIAMKLPAKPPKEPGTDHDLQAIGVARVMPDSGAQAAGLREDDLIVGIDGEPIENKGDKTLLGFRESISKKHSGDKVKLRVLRGEALLELEATIKPYPRVKSVLKPHPDLEKKLSGNDKSLLHDVLEKQGLTNEFVRLLKGFRSETDKVVSPLVRKDDYNPFRLQEVNYVMYHPLELPVVARKITDRLSGAFDQTHHDLGGLLQTAMDELDMAYVAAKPDEKKPADFSEYVERLVKAIQHANSERAAVLSVLDAGEIDFLYAFAPELLRQSEDTVKKKKTGKEKTETEKREDEARLLRFFQLVLKLDLPRLFNAAAEVARAIDLETLVSLDKTAGKLEHYPSDWVVHEEENLTVIDTPAGRVLIGGTKDNTYTEDAALILDFGGNDKYFNHAGGSTRLNPFSVVIDLSGDDLYSATDDFAQGAGLLGGGFLIDLEGNDRYMAKNYSQGAGILGIGILADLAGNDQYSAVSVSQGAASFGIGVLAEGNGDDTYFGNRFVQGFGFIKGFGAIVEAAGNDNYFAGGMFEDFRAPGKSYQSLSQGFGYGMRPWETLVGASGGIGVIAEAEGNDTYVADYFAQGSSYWFSLGILDDRKGNDRYIAGRYSQGAGIHMSAGILIDGEGDDSYLADYGVSQGCGHDYGIGFLLDNGGNDRYVSGFIAQGAGNDNGIGVLSDNGGDDEYYLKSLGQGRGNFEPARDLGSFGLLFDTGGGNDVYSSGDKNNSLNYKTQWGILLDTN
ncbi:MAG: PDZ domain-containing protein [Gallionellaceae bacterium]